MLVISSRNFFGNILAMYTIHNNNVTGAVALSGAVFNLGRGQNIHLTRVRCTGNESSLASCPAQSGFCYHEIAGVRCQQGQNFIMYLLL